MDNYQLMRMVELELRRHQKEARRRQKRGLPSADGQSQQQQQQQQQGVAARQHRRASREGSQIHQVVRSGKWDAAAGRDQVVPYGTIIPSPTGSECSFMSDDEFRSHFRFGDGDADGKPDADRYEHDDGDEYDLDSDDEDYGGRSGDDLESDMGSDEEGPYSGNGERYLTVDTEARRRQSLGNAWLGRSLTDDEHMAKWRKWESKHHGNSDHSDEENELQARADMMAMLKATSQARQQDTSSGDERSPRREVKRTRSASEKTEIANRAAQAVGMQIRISGDWGEQWLRREGSVAESDDDDRIMLVPEFEEDAADTQGKIFFIPFQSGSGESTIPKRPSSQVQSYIERFASSYSSCGDAHELGRRQDQTETTTTSEEFSGSSQSTTTTTTSSPKASAADESGSIAGDDNNEPEKPGGQQAGDEVREDKEQQTVLSAHSAADDETSTQGPHDDAGTERKHSPRSPRVEQAAEQPGAGEAHDRSSTPTTTPEPAVRENNPSKPVESVLPPQPLSEVDTVAKQEQRRKEKGKDKLHDDDDEFQHRAYGSASEVRRATKTRRPSMPTTTYDDLSATRKNDWVWDRDAAPSSPRRTSDSERTASPRTSATKRSPLLVREEPPPLTISRCVSCILS